MYSNKLVCSVKINQKILREKHEEGNAYVYIPYGSEYSLALKNLGGRNAVVKIEIDGQSVCNQGFYIHAGATVDIERFLENFNLDSGRKFKFIQKTKEISDHRGDRIDDGMIRVTWQFEKNLPEIKTVIHEHHHKQYNHNCWTRWCVFCHSYHCSCCPCFPNHWVYRTTYTSGFSSEGSGSRISASNFSNTMQSNNLNLPNENEGITVKGSISNQKFETATAGVLEENSHSMVILLRGFHDNNVKVQKPITVKEKKKCSTCGRRWRSDHEFCGNCGTALDV
jgi:hypothetical protein